MPSSTLQKVRELYPEFDDIPDNQLTVRLGNKYPKLLEKDNEFAKEYKGLTEFTVGGAASQISQKIRLGAPMMLGKIGWGVAEGLTAPVVDTPVGDFSIADVGVWVML